MASITYTAKRSIIKRPFVLTNANDISVSDVDNSFNSVTSDLSGLLASEWVYVTGFLTAANNGWHQLTIDAVTGKITTDSILVTEIAGELITLQGYLHGEGEQYNLEISLRATDYIEQERKFINESISGIEEEILHNWKETYSVTTSKVDEVTEKMYWVEFLHSVRAGESFTFDEFGTIAVPNNPLSVKLVGIPKYSRIQNARELYISFTVKVLT